MDVIALSEAGFGWSTLVSTLVAKGHMNLLILSWITAAFVVWTVPSP